jgi:hypothetical protein
LKIAAGSVLRMTEELQECDTFRAYAWTICRITATLRDAIRPMFRATIEKQKPALCNARRDPSAGALPGIVG